MEGTPGARLMTPPTPSSPLANHSIGRRTRAMMIDEYAAMMAPPAGERAIACFPAGRAANRKLARHRSERRPKRGPGAMDESKGFQTLLPTTVRASQRKRNKENPERRGRALFLHKSTEFFRLLAGSHSLGDEMMSTASSSAIGSRPESTFSRLAYSRTNKRST
jgi:hypothetical protein